MPEPISSPEPQDAAIPDGFAPYPPISGFMAQVGPLYARFPDDGIVVGLWVLPQHLNHQGAMHGGMVATLADNAMGYHAARAGETRVVTVNMSVDYIGRVQGGDWLEVHSRLDRRGGRLAFAACTGLVGGATVFRAHAVFSAVRRPG